MQTVKDVCTGSRRTSDSGIQPLPPRGAPPAREARPPAALRQGTEAAPLQVAPGSTLSAGSLIPALPSPPCASVSWLSGDSDPCGHGCSVDLHLHFLYRSGCSSSGRPRPSEHTPGYPSAHPPALTLPEGHSFPVPAGLLGAPEWPATGCVGGSSSVSTSPAPVSHPRALGLCDPGGTLSSAQVEGGGQSHIRDLLRHMSRSSRPAPHERSSQPDGPHPRPRDPCPAEQPDSWLPGIHPPLPRLPLHRRACACAGVRALARPSLGK